MQYLPTIIRVAAVVLTFALPTAASAASSVSSPLDVRANVDSNCTLQSQNMNFGTFDPLVTNATSELRVVVPIVVRCSLGTTHAIDVASVNEPAVCPQCFANLKNHAYDYTQAGAYGPIGLSMLSERGHVLVYDLMLDTPPMTSGTTAPTTYHLTAYIVPSSVYNQDPYVGAYSDTLIVSLTF